VDVGLLCHPGKLTPPAHVVKYTGLLFDTVREPILRIPPYKIDKALAMIDYILDHGNHLSRLSLAVVVGVYWRAWPKLPPHAWVILSSDISMKTSTPTIGRAAIFPTFPLLHWTNATSGI
jgi:hypothetical protein